MVQRAIVRRHDSAPPGEQQQAMETKVKRRRRPDAMTAIKARMLRCNRAKADQGHRFRRGYLAAGRGADSVAVHSTVFFYLACLVCTPRPSSVSIGVQKN